MFKPKVFMPSEFSPQRKLASNPKKPTINTSLQKSFQHKQSNSELSTPKNPNPYVLSKFPATTTAKKGKEVPKLLFAKIKQEQDFQLTTTRARKHKHSSSENPAFQTNYNYSAARPLENKLLKQLSSPNKFIESISSCESLKKAFTP